MSEQRLTTMTGHEQAELCTLGHSQPAIKVTRDLPQGIWDDYVTKNPAASVAHLHDWSLDLADTYELPVFLLSAVQELAGRVCGVLPLMLFAPPEGISRLISLPYTDAAGLLADDVECAKSLVLAAQNLAGRLDAKHLELRQAGRGMIEPTLCDIGWRHVPHQFKTGLRRALPTTTEELWMSLPAKVRNQVRKARRCQCEVAVGGMELLDDFYRVFSENMRDLGSPVHTLTLFRRLVGHRSLGCHVLVVYLGGAPAAGAIVLRLGQTMFNPWASSLRRHRPFCPNMLLYWSMLAHAIETGCNRFDFGRSSPDASTCRFKIQWGATMTPLTWHVFSCTNEGWNPRSESLALEEWKSFELERSHREGPMTRRWISL